MEEKETMGVMPEATQSAHAEAEVKETVSFAPKPEYREYGEDRSERREGRRVIRMEGGRTKLVLSSEAEEYRDTDGSWQDTDNTLEYRAAEDDDFAGYETKGNRYRVRLPENAKNAILMRVQEGESRLDIRLKERCRTAKGTLASRKGKVVNYERSVGEKGRKCGEIGYRNIFEKTDVRYNLEGGKIKESLVVKERRESYRYEFCIETTQAELVREETGGILIRRGEEQLFRIPEAFMEDANGEVSNAVAYELEEESAGHYHFAIAADAEWLNAEERAFPVVIDPTLIKETGVTLRCVGRTTKTKYDSSGCPCGTETVYATNSAIKVGKSGNTVYRSYVNFDLGDISLHNISTATLRLTLKATGSGTYYVARATQKSESSNTFVAKTPTREILTFDTVKDENDSNVYLATADITLSVREWQDGNSNYGIVVYGNEMANSSLEIESAALTFVCQDPYAKSSSSFQKNDVRRAGSSAVDLYAGRLLFEHKDFEFMSEILPLNISHEYNSDYNWYESSESMKLGKGWRLNVQQKVDTAPYRDYQEANGETIYHYIDSSGLLHEITKQAYFEETPGSDYETNSTRKVKRYAADGDKSEWSTKEGLVLDDPESDSGSFILKDKSGILNYFSKTGGYLTKVIAPGSKSYTITYSGGKITKVTDGAGKTATLEYTSSNYLNHIVCDNKVMSFSYTNGYLTKITYPDGTYTEFKYSGDRLIRVKDRSGYQLVYEYTDIGKVSSIREEVANETIGSTVTAARCPISGDCWDIKYLHSLQTQVKNRNGLVMEYIFDVDGNTVTMFEDNRSSSSSQKFSVCGKAIYKQSLVAEEKEALSNHYKTKIQTVEATLYAQENLIRSGIENWSTRSNLSNGVDGSSSEAYVEGSTSLKIVGSVNTAKSVQYDIGSVNAGIYVFGCWAKAENSLASVEKTYDNSNGRHFGLLVTLDKGSAGKQSYYASFDPCNQDWQLAAIAVDITSAIHVYVKVLYERNQGTVYFDHAFAAKTDGGIIYMYDRNYTETYYRGYAVATLYDENMNDVQNIIRERGKTALYRTINTFSENRPEDTTNYRGIKTARSYDNYGNLTQQTVSAGNLRMRETRTFTSGNYQTKAVNSDGSSTGFSYNTNGSLKSSTLPSGQVVSYAYDSMGEVTSVSAVVDGVTNKNEITYKYGYITKLKHGDTTYDFTYDGYGRVKTVRAGGATILMNTYTDFGTNLDGVSGAVSRVVSRDAVNNTVTTYTDKYGKSLGTKQGSSARSVEEYDDADNLTKHIDNVSGTEYNYEYNELRDITSYTEKKGTTTRVQMSSTYDSLNRPDTSSYTVNGKSYSYKCNYTSYPDEELATFVTPLGTVTYGRDALQRLTERKQQGQYRTFTETYEYHPNLTSSGNTTQLVRKLEFDTGTQVSTLEYSYDANANIKTIKSGASEVASYEYDGLNRLTRENIAGKKTVVYSYDGAGNLTSKKEYAYTTGALGAPTATKAYVYAGGTWGDRLTSYNGESIVYNAAGYPTTYRGSALTWNNGNLRRFGTTTFSYNDAGIRIKKGTTEYFVKGNQILAEKRGDTVIHYYYDDSGVAGFEYNGQKYYYRKNLQGDILAIYDCCGNMLGEYKYDAWGNILSQGGSELLTINPFRYRGYYYDTETGLYYLNSRYYDPETGRFISPDDVDVLSDTLTQPNGLNLYAYCYNNPVMMTDPDGAFTLTWWQKMLIGLAFIVLGAVVTAVTGGSFAAAFVCGLTYAVKSAVSGAVMGAVMGGLSAAFSGEDIGAGAVSGFIDGFFDGFMTGGITAGLGNVVKPGSFCFIAGTKVLTDHGHKNIEDIEVGDLVLAYDEETGETAYKPVVTLFRNTTKEWCTVFVRGNDGELYEITSTPGHKYFVPGNKVRKDSRALEHASYAGLSEKWVSACDLKRGDKVLLSDGTLCEVEGVSCKELSTPETTYNLEVAEFHTYYVSDACVLVHNARCHDLGKQGEEYIARTRGLSKNTRSYKNTGIPDFFDEANHLLIESKNVARQSFTKQLRTYLQYAKDHGMQMELYVRQGTKLSKNLLASGIKIMRFAW